MEIEQMEKIIDLMISKDVAAFEIGEFKVSFWPNAGSIPHNAERVNVPHEDQIDNDLGIFDEDV